MKKRIIIVDDEKTIREGLAMLIKGTNKYSVIALCKNGNEALETCKKYNPDIVITDIKMPVMDGLTFIKQYSAINNAKYIIISGYEEFEYARKAHKLHVYDYILKPIEYEKFINVLEKLCDEIDEETEESNQIKKQIGMLSLQPSISSLQVVNELSKKINIDVNNSQIALINFEYYKTIDSNTLDEINSFVNNFLKEKVNNITFIYDKKIVVLLLKVSINKESIPDYLKKIVIVLKEKYNLNTFIGIGRHCRNTIQIKDSYLQALSALSESLYENNNVFYYKPQWQSINNFELFFHKEKKGIIFYLMELNTDKCLRYIDRFVDKSLKERLAPDILFNFLKEIYNLCYNLTYGYKNEKICNINIDQVIEKLKYNCLTLNDLRELLYNIINETIDLLKFKYNKKYGNTIEEVIKYIDLNYHEDITLKKISSQFYINKSYFCKVFKEKTGKTFNNYLTEIRINKAKELMLNGDYKIYEVSTMVGFKDSKYFAKIFKEITGITPTKFKNTDIITY